MFPDNSFPLRIVLLAYTDNPVGRLFFETFRKGGIPLTVVVLARQRSNAIIRRMKEKLHKDGFRETFRRLFQVGWMTLRRQRIRDLALHAGVPVFWVDDMNGAECRTILECLRVDLLVIASAPILHPRIFTLARLGCLNVHPGWLPTYRGLGANAHALKQGDRPGVTVHFVDAGIDTGRIIRRERIPLRPHDTVARINDRAVARGAEMVVTIIRDLATGSLAFPEIQDPPGRLCHELPYREIRAIHRRLRSRKGS